MRKVEGDSVLVCYECLNVYFIFSVDLDISAMVLAKRQGVIRIVFFIIITLKLR